MAPFRQDRKGLSKEEYAERLSRGFEPITGDDWFMTVLAVVNVAMLVARDAYRDLLSVWVSQTIVVVDLVIVGVFAIEFLARMAHASSKIGYMRTHWYDLVGLIPVASPVPRTFRLVRLLRMYAVRNLPEGTTPDRSWMSSLVRGIIRHYRALILEEITDPIVMTSLNVIEGPLTRAKFAATLGKSIEERRADLHSVVEDAVRNTRGVGGLIEMRLVAKIVDNVTDTVIDTMVHTLKSEELNDVISESVRDVLNEIRDRVREKEYKMKGGGVFRPTLS